MNMFNQTSLFLLASILALLAAVPASSATPPRVWRFDCGTADSPVSEGYRRLTAAERYTPQRGYGWETEARSVVFGPQQKAPDLFGSYGRSPELVRHFDASRNALNADGVMSEGDLTFRLDVPRGSYRVTLTVGDMARAIGSIDLYVNGVRAGETIHAWAVGSYRMFHINPAGWWATVRETVQARDGFVRITLRKNQSDYDRLLVEQGKEKTPYAQWHHGVPILQEPPYSFIGIPFVHNSIMALEVTPLAPGPVVSENEKLRLAVPLKSPSLLAAIEKFNAGDFPGSLSSLKQAAEPEAREARAVVALWLAGRPECEEERTLVPAAIEVLKTHVAKNPEAYGLGELLQDAEIFRKALDYHLNRGRLDRVHFIENDKAIGLWWLIREDSPLFYKTQIYIGRAGHMLKPYKPILGTEADIFKRLERKFPDNRYVKYMLHRKWEPFGDGSSADHWAKKDYSAAVKGAPKWVQSLYPAWATMLDWSEWFVKFKQYPEGNIGGGWGDDVEVIGTFGYYGFTTRDASGIALEGARRMIDGMWRRSEVDPESGFCFPMADAEHSAEWTGNTLGMMTQIDFGNPTWIERSMKTAKLMRDLWTAYDKNGHRRFRANYFGGTQVGSGDQMNDTWINYRAIRPATAVLQYNNNPVIAKLYVELAEAWLASTLSTDRGKPRGIIPAQVSFPDAILGGTNSPNWWTASHPKGTDNADWNGLEGTYKGYLQDVMIAAFQQTRDPKYLEPLRLEYEFAKRHGNAPESPTGARMEIPAEWRPSRPQQGEPDAAAGLTPGSEEWAGRKLRGGIQRWLAVQSMLEGRKGPLRNDITKADIIRFSDYILDRSQEYWPMMTTEASATDRVDWSGSCNAFFFYTGGSWGGPYWQAPITYEDTTREFCAAVMANDTQCFRILYYSLAPGAREFGILPWALEAGGRYRLVMGPDDNDDEKMDSVAESREFDFPQAGTAIRVRVDSRRVYLIEVDQIRRGRGPKRAADPGLSNEDIEFDTGFGLLTARIHNAGAEAARNVEVAFYQGAPAAGGRKIGQSTIPYIEAPNDLSPQTVKVGVSWKPPADGARVYVVVDPEDRMPDEITTFNNKAWKMIRPAAGLAVGERPAAGP